MYEFEIFNSKRVSFYLGLRCDPMLLYRQYETARIKAVCCGPSTANYCPVGARTVSPCAHGGAVLFAGCVLANNPLLFNTTHRDLNIIDPGSGLPLQYAVDTVSGSIS